MNVHTEIEIDAPIQKVWEILVDLPNYSAWNKFIPRAVGEPKVGEKLKLFVCPPGLMHREFEVEVTSIVQPLEFSWLGKFLMNGLLDGHHFLVLESISPNRTRLIQKEDFSGWLVPLLKNKIRDSMLQAFAEMNLGVKKQAEQKQA